MRVRKRWTKTFVSSGALVEERLAVDPSGRIYVLDEQVAPDGLVCVVDRRNQRFHGVRHGRLTRARGAPTA